jgi:uncharacterized protein (DUF1501 family)
VPTDTLANGGISRRKFMAGTAATAAAAGATMALGPRYAFASPEIPTQGDVIVMVFLRGGADGLSLVAPWMMPSYRTLRPTIRIKDDTEFADPTGVAGLPLVQGGNVQPFALSGTLAMHPGMANLYNGAWAAGNLAMVHAAGMPKAESDTRSHFEAETNWEFGSASYSITNGFLGRFLQGQPGVDRLPGIGRGSNLQRSLEGPVGSLSMNSISSFNVGGYANNTQARTALSGFYKGGTSDLLMQTGANTIAAIGSVTGINWAAAQYQPQNGAVYGNDDLARNLKETAMLIRGNLGLRVVAIDFGGWDTHDTMGMPEDPSSWFRNRATTLANALQAFYTDLGTAMDEVTLFTVSEFGRTIDENGSGGTDHGRGSVMFALGRKIRGGVYGSFVPSVVDGPEGDLAVLNDYRRPVSEILSVRGGAASLGTIFPTYSQTTPLGLCVS